MRSYHSVVILKPDLDDALVEQNLDKVKAFIAKSGGEVVKAEKWGKKRLSYRVKKNRFGIYLSVFHTCNTAQVAALENEYRLYDPIVKAIVVRLEPDELAYAMGKQQTLGEDDGKSDRGGRDSRDGDSPTPGKRALY